VKSNSMFFPRSRVLPGFASLVSRFASLLHCRPFAQLTNEKLADHRWATESALLRAVRCGQVQAVPDLTRLASSMEREMRRRGIA
jgi:hypothetical protein